MVSGSFVILATLRIFKLKTYLFGQQPVLGVVYERNFLKVYELTQYNYVPIVLPLPYRA